MQQTFLIAGLACLIAAIVGGGLKAFGIEIPLLSSRVRQTVLGLLGVILIAAGTIPHYQSPADGTDGKGRSPSLDTPIGRVSPTQGTPVGGAINVRLTANPHAIPAGGQAEVKVLAFTEQNSPVTNASVRIESGGGWFSVSGTTTEIGKTDANGIFTTQWRSPNPAAAAYGMSVSVSKEGFTEGKGECLVPIQ